MKDNLQGDNFSMAALKTTPELVGKINTCKMMWRGERIATYTEKI